MTEGSTVTNSPSTDSTFTAGDTVTATFLRDDDASGQAVLQVSPSIPAYMSWYDMTDATFDARQPGATISATVVRVARFEGTQQEYLVLEETRALRASCAQSCLDSLAECTFLTETQHFGAPAEEHAVLATRSAAYRALM
jgi:hypothetical protein